jgi:hypothetical protein
MKNIRIVLIAVCIAVLGGGSFAGTVHVRDYYRKDGTYVHAYDRSSPGTGSSVSSVSEYEDSRTGTAATTSVSMSAPRFIPAPNPAADPNWVPAKMVSGQYIPAHLKNDPDFAAINKPALAGASIRGSHTHSARSGTQRLSRTTQWRQSVRSETSYTSSTGVIERDSRGHIKRSESAKHRFMHMTGHPNGWPGHVVDHIIPLKRGGADDPSNMQWQTVEEARAKDKWE